MVSGPCGYAYTARGGISVSLPIKVLFVFSRATRAEQQSLLAHEQTPDDLLYGFLKLDESAFERQSVTRCLNEWTWRRYAYLPLELAIARQVGMGFALSFARDHLSYLRAADVIVSTVDAVGLPLAWLKRRGQLATPLLYLCQGLTDRLEGMPKSSWRRRWWQRFYASLLGGAERVVVLGEGAREPLLRLLRLAEERVAVVPFGVDAQFWRPRLFASGGYILSVGSDQARDYATLVAAVDKRPLKIVTRLPVPEAIGRPNVAVNSQYSEAQLRDLYQRAACVVTPLKDVSQPSGQSATLQAMACGKAVIVTRTRGLWDPAVMQHLYNCYLVAPGDVAGMRAALQWLTAHPNEVQRLGAAARATVEERYTSTKLAEAMRAQIYAAL